MKLINRKVFSLIFAGVITAISDQILMLSDNIVTGQLIGDEGLSAMQLIMPLYNFIIFFALLIGFGNVVNISLEVGRGNREKANEYFSNGFYTTIGFGAIMTGLLMAIRTPFLNSFGVNAEIYSLASSYLNGMMFLPLIIPLNYYLYDCITNEGGEKVCIVCTIVQIGLNIGLSILLGRVWGIFGVGLAMVLSLIAGTLILSIAFFKKGCGLKLKKFYSFKCFFRSLKLGFFDASIFLYNSLFIYVINWFILSRFNESYLSVFLIITNLISMAVAVCDGVLVGMQPLVGVYNGENNPRGVKRIMKLCLKILLALSAVFSLVLFVFAESISLLLGANDPSILADAVIAIRIYCIGIVFTGLGNLYSSYLLYTGHSVYPLLFGTIQFGICQIGLPILFSLIFGASGLWVGLLTAPILTLIINVSIILIKNRSLSPLLLNKTTIEKSKIFDCNANAVDVMKMADEAEEFALNNGFSKPEALKARLLTEEIGMSIVESNGGNTQIECSILAEEKLRLIFRDNGKSQNLTDLDRPVENKRVYFASNIISMYRNKNFVRATNFNRCMFCIERGKE